MTIHRAADGVVFLVSCAAMQDPRLSLRARGLLGFVLSLPSDEPVTSDWLASQVPDSPGEVDAALADLERCGYYRHTGTGHARLTDVPGPGDGQ